jgi:hypothetical protein
MTTDVLARVLNLDSGLVHTAHRLTTDPGQVIRDYLARRTISYTSPAAYLLIGFAAFAITGATSLDAWWPDRLFGDATAGKGARVFVALLVPFVAAVSSLLFWRAGLNYAEHLILVMYVLGHMALLLSPVHIALPLAGEVEVFGFITLILGAAYVAWAYSRVFQTRPILAAAGGLMALGTGVLLWAAVLVIVLIALRN